MSVGMGKYSVTMPREVAEAARERSGVAGLSSYVATAVARQLEQDGLGELVEAIGFEHGPITPEQIEAKREILRRAMDGKRRAAA